MKILIPSKLPLWIALLILSSCSTSNKASIYPKKLIDRPYTLFEGMSNIQITLTQGYSKSTSFYDRIDPIPLNFYWTHAVSDQLSFIWFILPLGFRYQWIHTPEHILGIQFYNHIGDPDHPNLSPYFNFTERTRLSQDFEIQTLGGIQNHILFKDKKMNWNFSLIAGPRWQAGEIHSLYLWIGPLYESNPENTGTQWHVGTTYILELSTKIETEFRLTQKIFGSHTSEVSDTSGAFNFRYGW